MQREPDLLHLNEECLQQLAVWHECVQGHRGGGAICPRAQDTQEWHAGDDC